MKKTLIDTYYKAQELPQQTSNDTKADSIFKIEFEVAENVLSRQEADYEIKFSKPDYKPIPQVIVTYSDVKNQESRVMELLSNLHVNISEVVLWYHYLRMEAGAYINKALSQAVNLNRLTVFYGDLSTYTNTINGPSSTAQRIEELIFSSATINTEVTLPLLSKDLLYLNVLKFLRCELIEDSKTVNIHMETTSVDQLLITGEFITEFNAPILLSISGVESGLVKYYVDLEDNHDSTMQISNRKFNSLTQYGIVKNCVVVSLKFKPIKSLLLETEHYHGHHSPSSSIKRRIHLKTEV